MQLHVNWDQTMASMPQYQQQYYPQVHQKSLSPPAPYFQPTNPQSNLKPYPSTFENQRFPWAWKIGCVIILTVLLVVFTALLVTFLVWVLAGSADKDDEPPPDDKGPEDNKDDEKREPPPPDTGDPESAPGPGPDGSEPPVQGPPSAANVSMFLEDYYDYE